MDMTVLFGFLVGFGGIIIGNLMEDGHTGALLQGAAAIIVLGGTLGATLVANRMKDVKLAFQLFRSSLRKEPEDVLRTSADELVEAARLVRKESVLALEARLPGMSDDWTRSVFRMVIDGIDPQILRRVFENEIDIERERLLAGAKVWSDAGGYAPTIGIIGAVLGLIHVMGNLTNTAELGKGIAVAFVATIYGIALANLVFIPISQRIKGQVRRKSEHKQMVLEGGLAVLAGLNPYLVEQEVRPFVTTVENEKRA